VYQYYGVQPQHGSAQGGTRTQPDVQQGIGQSATNQPPGSAVQTNARLACRSVTDCPPDWRNGPIRVPAPPHPDNENG
jgi:hypothetical protein